MTKLFGTDGIRGLAGVWPITPELCLKLAVATAHTLCTHLGKETLHVVIGKDTRLSGYMIEPALTSGFISAGCHVTLLGPVPTAAVAMLTRSLRADLGVMITASHNPYQDNGVKFFGPLGYKLDDDMEHSIEQFVTNPPKLNTQPHHLGRADRLDDAVGRIIEHAKGTFPRHLTLHGLKIAVDCAHGAAYKIAPRVLWELGAEVVSLGCSPDGLNINKNCGALYTDALAEQVLAHKAHIGLAFDGDADRLMVVDEKGQLVSGEHLMACLARTLDQQGQLKSKTVVSTIMANMALETYLADHALKLERTAVGDRPVLERMRSLNSNLGGEPSGHFILGDLATTGDGLIAALQLLAHLVETGHSASYLTQQFTLQPQKLVNISTSGPARAILQTAQALSLMKEIEASLLPQQRLLVRPSGTENLIRVMVEGENAPQKAQEIADQLSNLLS